MFFLTLKIVSFPTPTNSSILQQQLDVQWLSSIHAGSDTHFPELVQTLHGQGSAPETAPISDASHSRSAQATHTYDQPTNSGVSTITLKSDRSLEQRAELRETLKFIDLV